jgi:hypothetical protein
MLILHLALKLFGADLEMQRPVNSFALFSETDPIIVTFKTSPVRKSGIANFLSFLILSLSSLSSSSSKVFPLCIVGLGSFGGQSKAGFSHCSSFGFLLLSLR